MRFQSLRCGADVFPRRVLCGPPGGKSRYNGYFRNLLKHIKIARAYVGIEKKKKVFAPFTEISPRFHIHGMCVSYLSSANNNNVHRIRFLFVSCLSLYLPWFINCA